jgi:hypothetical protein
MAVLEIESPGRRRKPGRNVRKSPGYVKPGKVKFSKKNVPFRFQRSKPVSVPVIEAPGPSRLEQYVPYTAAPDAGYYDLPEGNRARKARKKAKSSKAAISGKLGVG